MLQHKDTVFVLGRIDYGERDRILTVLGRSSGKLTVLAKGVRSARSKLAGGTELLCSTEITFVDSRSEIKPLTGARLSKYYEQITRDVDATNVAFTMLRTVDKLSENGAGQEYFSIIEAGFEGLNDSKCNSSVTQLWFNLQVLRLSGSLPDFGIDNGDQFAFDFEKQKIVGGRGEFTKVDVKLLRLCATSNRPPRLSKIPSSAPSLCNLTKNLVKLNVTEV